MKRDGGSISAACGVLHQKFGERFQTGKALREQHAHTTTWIGTEPPDAVVSPNSTEDVRFIVETCANYRVPVVPFGTGTSLEGQVNAPGGGVSVNFVSMKSVLAVNDDDLDCRVQPGITRKELNSHLRDTGLFFPVDPGADASIGGMASTRASGTNAVRYGTMKDNVLALKVVLPDGQLITTGGRARKSSAGYDLTSLFVGAEGTLGIITELTLRLFGQPEQIASARCCFPDLESACRTVIETSQFGIPVARMELLDAMSVKAVNAYSRLALPETPLLLLEFHGTSAGVAEQTCEFGEIAATNGGTQFIWDTDLEKRNKIWQARHDAYWATLRLRPGSKAFVTDVCVPISRLAETVDHARHRAERLGLLAPIVGHAGDGNFHFSILVDDKNRAELETASAFTGWLNDLAIAMEGTCTGEHGIGQGKREYLRRELGDAVDVMAAIKAAIDPENIMNPGKIFRFRSHSL